MNEKLPYINALCMTGKTFRILTVSALNADAGNRENIAESLSDMIDRASPDLVFFCGDITRDASDAEKLRETLAVILAPVM